MPSLKESRGGLGTKKVIVALGRKLLTIICHLLTRNETFEKEGHTKNGEVSIPDFLKLVQKIGEEEAINLIQQARLTKLKLGIQKKGSVD